MEGRVAVMIDLVEQCVFTIGNFLRYIVTFSFDSLPDIQVGIK